MSVRAAHFVIFGLLTVCCDTTASGHNFRRLHTSKSSSAAPPPPPAFVPWVLAADTDLGTGIPFAGSGAEPFLGIFATEAGCRAFCAAQSNCTQYTWNNISTNKLWTQRCYGRHDTTWLPSDFTGCYSGRRVPLPPPPGPPPPVPPGLVSLSVQTGALINPHLFGYDLEEWGSPLNLTYNDTAGMSLTEALHPGVLRYPSGTGSNIWDTIHGRFVPAPTGNPGGYHGWETELAPPVNGLPVGTFSGKSFLAGLGGKAKRVVWALNVYSLSVKETCEQIAYIADLPGQQAPGVLLELGNELWSTAQGLPNFPNATAYAEAMVPIVECARRYMPNAKIGACGQSGLGWNPQLRPYFEQKPPLFDGLSIHEYDPDTSYVLAQPADERVSYVAAYSWAAAFGDAKSQRDEMGRSIPIWLTEFGFGLDQVSEPAACAVRPLLFGAKLRSDTAPCCHPLPLPPSLSLSLSLSLSVCLCVSLCVYYGHRSTTKLNRSTAPVDACWKHSTSAHSVHYTAHSTSAGSSVRSIPKSTAIQLGATTLRSPLKRLW